LQTAVHQAHALDHVVAQLTDILEAALALNARETAKLGNHRLPVGEVAVHLLGVRQPWLTELADASAGRQGAPNNEAPDFDCQAGNNHLEYCANRQPSIRKLSSKYADDRRTHADAKRPGLHPARLTVDAMFNQPLHPLVEPVEGQFLLLRPVWRIESALCLHIHCVPLPAGADAGATIVADDSPPGIDPARKARAHEIFWRVDIQAQLRRLKGMHGIDGKLPQARSEAAVTACTHLIEPCTRHYCRNAKRVSMTGASAP
jgi:hypothetical protein